MTMHALQDMAGLLREPGPWCTVHAEVSSGTVTSREAAEVLTPNLARAVADAGGSEEDARAAAEVEWASPGTPGPVSRFVLIRGGQVMLNEVLPGAPERALVEVGPIPHLLPLAEVRGSDVDYLVVQAERAEAEIGRYRASARGALDSREVRGSTENLTKVPVGGYSQGKYQHRTEEIWRRNGADVAAEVNRIVDEGSEGRPVELVVIAGDERARLMVQDALSERAAALVQTLNMNSSAPGADRERFDQEVDALVARAAARKRREALTRLVDGIGRSSAGGWAETLHALREARVGTLILCPESAAGQTLLALGSEPWVAESEADALGAPVLGSADAAVVLLRAAILTKADTVLVPVGALDGGGGAAALLRW